MEGQIGQYDFRTKSERIQYVEIARHSKITMIIPVHNDQKYAQSTNALTLATRSVSLTLAMCNFTRFVLLFKASA